jgi:hypothetical protein
MIPGMASIEAMWGDRLRLELDDRPLPVLEDALHVLLDRLGVLEVLSDDGQPASGSASFAIALHVQ